MSTQVTVQPVLDPLMGKTTLNTGACQSKSKIEKPARFRAGFSELFFYSVPFSGFSVSFHSVITILSFAKLFCAQLRHKISPFKSYTLQNKSKSADQISN
jgi:hypothetical protein